MTGFQTKIRGNFRLLLKRIFFFPSFAEASGRLAFVCIHPLDAHEVDVIGMEKTS